MSNKTVIDIYDPPMCCPTGVCGPAVDPALLAIQETILTLQREHADRVEVRRHMLTTHPAAFLEQPDVAALLRTPEGLKRLPAVTVNGRLVETGRYPALAELLALIP